MALIGAEYRLLGIEKPKFKVGDRIKNIGKFCPQTNPRAGLPGVIRAVDDSGSVYVDYIDGGTGFSRNPQDYYEVANDKPTCKVTGCSNNAKRLTTDKYKSRCATCIKNKKYHEGSIISDYPLRLPEHFGELNWGASLDRHLLAQFMLRPGASIKKSRGIMSRIGEFVKNSLLSADEKLLRKYDLKDECGDYTCTAKDLVIGKLIKDNEAFLIETAQAFEAEQKANK